MAVTVKSEKQIALMREAGRLLAITHEELHKALKPGMTTLDIDRLGEEIIRDFGCVPNFKNYNGFPASICVSINDEVVHGIPTDKRVLKEGDIVSLDAGLIYKGYHSDAARTWGDLVGHGIGTHLHEDPEIPNFRTKGRGIRLMAGMTLAIEPMVNAGTWEVACEDDDWTIVTDDGSLSAHYENTILVTKDGCEILTLR